MAKMKMGKGMKMPKGKMMMGGSYYQNPNTMARAPKAPGTGTAKGGMPMRSRKMDY